MKLLRIPAEAEEDVSATKEEAKRVSSQVEAHKQELEDVQRSASIAASQVADAFSRADKAVQERDEALARAQTLSTQLLEVQQKLSAATSGAQAAADTLRVQRQEADALRVSFETERAQHLRALEMLNAEMQKATACKVEILRDETPKLGNEKMPEAAKLVVIQDLRTQLQRVSEERDELTLLLAETEQA